MSSQIEKVIGNDDIVQTELNEIEELLTTINKGAVLYLQEENVPNNNDKIFDPCDPTGPMARANS